MFQAINPATGEALWSVPRYTPGEVEAYVAKTHAAQADWRRRSFAERAAVLRGAAAELRRQQPLLAETMALEMGKPLAQGRGEAEKCAWVCEHYATHAEVMLAPEVVQTEAAESLVAYTPLGIVLAIMPWNFPLWQVFRFAAPSLMAGNAVLLKHAPNVPRCAQQIEALLRAAGLPEGVFTSLFIDIATTEALIGDPRIAAVTLTGSTRAGKAVAGAAARHLKKSVLELGGSDPYIILADADLDRAAETCATSRLLNSGQSCIAAKRFIVVEDVKEAFTDRLLARMAARRLGDPLEAGVDVGPQARQDLRDELHRQVAESLAAGARLRLGGVVPRQAGAWYPVTMLTDVHPGMPAWEEEFFGPVASVIAVRDEAEALRVANGSPYGLGAAIFTADVARARRLALEEIEAGAVFVNDFVKSDPRLPFGGIKMSGWGRELGLLGIRELTNAKTLWIR